MAENDEPLGYHKIMGPFKRNVDGPNKNQLIPWEWTRPEFGFLQHVPWRWTEKVDGTNVRVVWDSHKPTFLGRTSRAQMPAKLLSVLQAEFTEPILEQVFGETPVTLFGEGYGPGIQKGGIYTDRVRFILFDVHIGNVWLEYPNMAGVADSLGVDVVPVHVTDTLNHMIKDMTGRRIPSLVSDAACDGKPIMDWPTAEGLVGTPLVPLNDRKGSRLIVKLKGHDLQGLDLSTVEMVASGG